MNTDRILSLVQKALDDFDDRPLEVSIRRLVRIATLMGETETAIRFSMEIRPIGGSPVSNAEDAKRLMENPSEYSNIGSPSEIAINKHLADRLMKDGKIYAHTVTELEYIDTLFRRDENAPGYVESKEVMEARSLGREIVARVRARAFSTLCGWERQLTFQSRNEQIFQRFQKQVNDLLRAQNPEIVDSFNAVYRRLNDANRLQEADATQELSQAVTSCRRVLKAVIDSVLPPEAKGEVDTDGKEHSLDDHHYRNRVSEFIKRQTGSDTYTDAVKADFSGVIKRFKALDDLASKGVHAGVAHAEAEYCSISTYILAGEIVSLANKVSK